VAHTHILTLTLIWPAGTAARAAPRRRIETTIRERVRAGRRGERGEAGRLRSLVERLWLRATENGSRADAGPGRQAASQLVLQSPQVEGSQDSPDASFPTEGAPQPVAPPEPPRTERRAARLSRHPAPRPGRLGPVQAGAIRHGAVKLAASEAPTTSVAPARPRAANDRGETGVRGRSPSPESSRPPLPRAALVWRKAVVDGESLAATHRHRGAFGVSGSERVWRRPAAATVRDATGGAEGGATTVVARDDGYVRAAPSVAPTPVAPAAPPAAAMPPAEMSRLVDEVVRRLERIGRDERLRRGL
jgi:hypothetical protein